MEEAIQKNLPCREKYWDELTDTQKIERMRSIVKSMQYQLQTAVATIDKLTNHQHNMQNGEIVVPLKDNRYGAEESPRRFKDDKYF